jgi:hypothetical protein
MAVNNEIEEKIMKKMSSWDLLRKATIILFEKSAFHGEDRRVLAQTASFLHKEKLDDPLQWRIIPKNFRADMRHDLDLISLKASSRHAQKLARGVKFVMKILRCPNKFLKSSVCESVRQFFNHYLQFKLADLMKKTSLV